MNQSATMTGCWVARRKTHRWYSPYGRDHSLCAEGEKAALEYSRAAREWALIDANRPVLCRPGWREACKIVGGRKLLKRADEPVKFGKYSGVRSGTVAVEAPAYMAWCSNLSSPCKGVVELVKVGVAVMRAQIEYEAMIQELRERDARRVRLRKCVLAVMTCQRLWRLADERARERFAQDRDACLLEAAQIPLVVMAR